MADRTMTLRLPERQAEALETVAEVEGLAVVEVVRLAVSEYIDRRRRDPSFQERLQVSMDRASRARDRLRWPDRGSSGAT